MIRTPVIPRWKRRKNTVTCNAIVVLVALTCRIGFAQSGTLSDPFPAPSPNAALHYQRALLHLAALSAKPIGPLAKPIWEVTTDWQDDDVPQDVSRLLHKGRFAIREAATGSRTAECNFGIDFRGLGAATQVPHAKAMVDLGRLLTLRGAQAEAKGEWQEAAVIYFDGLRMGRHLTHQQTLVEGMAGLEILRNNYFALARWSVRCPSRPLVARVFGLMESMQASLVNPSQLLARESSILSLEFQRLGEAFPSGIWAEMILESYNEEISGEREVDAKRAVAASVKRGVPAEAFASTSAFHEYVSKLSITGSRFAESLAACMTLPPRARLDRAESLGKKYAKLIKVLAADALVDPVDTAILFSEQEAELALVRTVLAVSASKSDGRFPEALDDVASRFGGRLPLSPYNDQAIEYETRDDRRAFSLMIPQVQSLPAVDFNSRPPVPAKD